MSDIDTGAPEGAPDDTTLAPQAEAPQADAEGEELPSGDDAAAAPPEGQKPRKSVQERIDELTAKQRQAERDAEYWRSEAMKAQPQPKAETPKDDAEPNPADYTYGETDAAFIRDHATYHANRTFEARLQAQERQREAQTVEQGWQASRSKTADKHGDFYEVVDRGQWPCTPVMADAIKTSEAGGDVAYHLGKNPDEARRIAGLNPISQIREIGRLEARLAATQPQPNRTPGAPAPPNTQVRGAGGQFKPAADTEDFEAFKRTYGA